MVTMLHGIIIMDTMIPFTPAITYMEITNKTNSKNTMFDYVWLLTPLRIWIYH